MVRTALAKRSLDNVTGVLITFEPLLRRINANPKPNPEPAAQPYSTFDSATPSRKSVPMTFTPRNLMVLPNGGAKSKSKTSLRESEGEFLLSSMAVAAAAPQKYFSQRTYDEGPSRKKLPVSKSPLPQTKMLKTFHASITLRPIAKKLVPTAAIVRRQHVG